MEQNSYQHVVQANLVEEEDEDEDEDEDQENSANIIPTSTVVSVLIVSFNFVTNKIF